jgi:hypothetical protein
MVRNVDDENKLSSHTLHYIIMNQEDDIKELRKEISDLREDVNKLISLWQQSLGAIKIIKVLVLVIAPVYSLIVWFNNHVKL